MKKKLEIVIKIILVLILSTNFNVVNAAFADFDETKAEQEAQNQIKEQKKELENIENKSKNNYLKSLSIEGYKLEPAFDKQTQEYTIKGTNKDSKLTINAVADDSKAKVSGTGEVELKGDSIRIDVTAESGTVRTYIVKYIEQDEKQEEKTEEENEEIDNETVETIGIVQNEVEATSNIEEQNNTKTKNDNIIWYIVGSILAVVIIIIIIVNNKMKRNGKHF